MFQRFTRTVHQIHFRTWPHVELKRFFTVSVASGVWQPPETRQNDPYTWKNPETRHREYLRFKERYKTDATFRTKIQLRVRTRTQARRALLNEEEEHKRILTERFRQWLKLRLEKGGLPDWETHVPEVVDGSMVRRCVSCGRVHYKGCTKIWWKNKQDVQYEVYECFPCFTKDFSKVIPKGFEGKKPFRSILEWIEKQNQTLEETSPKSDFGPDLTS